MNNAATTVLVLCGLFIGFVGGSLVRGEFSVSKAKLNRCGYEVHEYSMSKDGVYTNWVEVTRTDGRPLQCGR